MHRHRAVVAALALVTAFGLSACTPDDAAPQETASDDAAAADDGGPGTQASDGSGADDAASATVADGEMASVSTATPHGNEQGGGEVTVVLRSVEVAGATMTVRWALRWDDDEAPADAGLSYYDMGIEPVTTVTDRENLQAYRPFCTEGAWQAEASEGLSDIADANLARIQCTRSMLVSPLENVSFDFPNHGAVESWAVLPAPEGRPAMVDVAPVDGLPLFTDATVTYTEDGTQ